MIVHAPHCRLLQAPRYRVEHLPGGRRRAYLNEDIRALGRCTCGAQLHSAPEDDTVRKEYAYHQPSPAGLEKIAKLRAHFSEGARLIEELCDSSRERSIALTNNEQTAMWSIKAVVFHDVDSVVEAPTDAPAGEKAGARARR